jgi:hypothetical protein
MLYESDHPNKELMDRANVVMPDSRTLPDSRTPNNVKGLLSSSVLKAPGAR